MPLINRRKQWIAVIDDRERVADGVAEGHLRAEGTRGAAGAHAGTARGPGRPRHRDEADLEAIVALPNGTFVMAEEGHVSDGDVWQPALLQITRDGVVTNVIEFPKEFQITGDGKTGLRDNQGFEGLAITPRGRADRGTRAAAVPGRQP